MRDRREGEIKNKKKGNASLRRRLRDRKRGKEATCDDGEDTRVGRDDNKG